MTVKLPPAEKARRAGKRRVKTIIRRIDKTSPPIRKPPYAIRQQEEISFK